MTVNKFYGQGSDIQMFIVVHSGNTNPSRLYWHEQILEASD